MNSWRALPLLTASLIFFPGLVKADRFAVAVVGDTQYTIEEAPEVFLAQMEWIVRNRDNPDNPIVYVATLGDMKNDGNCDVKNVRNPETGVTMSEWQILNFGYGKLDQVVPRIPYGVVPGNHDYFLGGTSCFQGDPNDDRTNLLNSSPDPSPAEPFDNSFNELFGPARFSGTDWYGGSEVENDNEDNYTLFSSHGIDFIAINLGMRQFAYLQEGNGDCAPPGSPKQLHDEDSHVDSLCDLVDGNLVDGDVVEGDGTNLHDTELHWANGLLNQFPDRLAIITSHYIMQGNEDRNSGDYRSSAFGPYGQQLYDFLGGHPNLFMMLGAHERGEAWIVNNRTGNLQPVHGLLSNYQDLDFPDNDESLTDEITYLSLPEHNGGTSHSRSTMPVGRHDNGFSGFMRLMTFDTDTGLVDIETFMPLIPANVIANFTANVNTDYPYPARRIRPANAIPPADRIPSTRSTDAATNDNVVTPNEVRPGLTLTDRTATNINGISFVGYVNLPPTASNVTITDNNGGSADVGDTLTGNYSFNDLDANDVESNSSFRWLRDGLAIDGATGRSYTLAAADGGQPVSFEVTPAASAGPAGVPVASAAVSVTAAPQGPQPFIQTGSLANDTFLRFLSGANIPAAEVNDRCADGDGCRITLTRVYGGTTTVFGPCNFSNNPAANQFQLLSTNCAVIGTGINANSGTETIFGVAANTNCRFSDWDTSGNGGNGDQNANFSVLISNTTATTLTCTFRIDD